MVQTETQVHKKKHFTKSDKSLLNKKKTLEFPPSRHHHFENFLCYMFHTNYSELNSISVKNFFRHLNNSYQPSDIMEGFGQLLAFSLVMLFGSYAAGSLPLFVAMSEKNLHLVSVLGAGLLLGVALAVIIPEGLQTLIKAYNTSPSEMGKTL